MNLPDYYSYVAIFSQDADGWLIEFPDLERCATNANTLDEAIIQANNILEDYVAILERDGMPIPTPTPYEKVDVPVGGYKQKIVVSMKNARMRWGNKSIKRTVRLPAWVDQKVVEMGLNLSDVLNDTLMKLLKVKVSSK